MTPLKYLERIALAVIVGLIVGFLVWLVGLILVDITNTVTIDVGHVFERISPLVGLIAGIWYYIKGTL